MDYKTIKALNERSKAINRARGMIYINSVELVKREDLDDSILVDYTEESIKTIPNEVFVCDYEDYGYSLFYSDKVLLSELMMGLICCELWVSNIEVLKRNDILYGIEFFSTYTPIRMIYTQDDRMARVFVDNVAVSVFCLSELMGKSAKEYIYQKTLHNLRAYGFITLPIENALEKEIENGVMRIRIETGGVIFGVDDNNKYHIQR